MLRLAAAGLALLLCASSAAAEPPAAPEPGPQAPAPPAETPAEASPAAAATSPASPAPAPDGNGGLPSNLADRFAAFDQAAKPDWLPAFPEPLVREVAASENDAVPMQLSAGAYMIVALCDCDLMDVTLVRPDGSVVQPARVSDQGAMYSLEATASGSYLAGIDMGACEEPTCRVAVKVYRKK